MQNTANAMMMKSRMTEIRLPKLTAISGSTTSLPSITASLSTHFHAEKSTPPVRMETSGMIISFTSEVVILPNAPPMTTPMAISSTLPRMANALNSSINFFIRSLLCLL